MKRIVLFLALAVIPLMAEAQVFTPDLPEDRGLFLFLSASVNAETSRGSGWMIMSGEKVTVESLAYNGWAKVKYVNKEGTEFDGYLRIRSLKPFDPADTAAVEMLALAHSRADLETKVITIGLILAGIGLVLSFLPWKFAGILQALAFLALCGLEIWFLRTTGGFTIYSPSVYGWKTAAKWFLCLVLFIAVQIKIWTGILGRVAGGDGIGDGIFITLILSLLAFVAMIITVFVVPANQFDTWFWRVYYISLALNLIQVLKNFKTYGFVRGVVFNIFLMAGLYATSLMAIDMVVVAITGIVAGALLYHFALMFARGDIGDKSKHKMVNGEWVRDYAAEAEAERKRKAENERAGLL